MTTLNMKEICLNLLVERGVELNDISEVVYGLQEKYVPGLDIKTCDAAIHRVLDKREVQNAILTGIELDVLAEKKLLSEPRS